MASCVEASCKAEVTFALRRGYGGRTPSELRETCGGRRETEVASGWPYVVWLYFTGRRVAVELKRGVITFFISTFAVAIRQAETKELVKKKLVTVHLAARSP